MITALLDGDVFVYHAATACEEVCQWDSWLWTRHVDIDDAINVIDSLIDQAAQQVFADKLVVALSHEANWRMDVMPTYKHTRVGKPKPVAYHGLREHLKQEYDTYVRPTLEGDDILGILATHPKLVKGNKIIVSIDKDMKTIPGLYRDYRKEITHEINQHDADLFHMMQTLAGDLVDGYPGCPGVGMVTAERLLGGLPPGEWWPSVVEKYREKGLGEEVALQNARVSRILRHTDYDFKKKEVKLWLPPKGK